MTCPQCEKIPCSCSCASEEIKPLLEGRDFYLEGGLFIFTEAYHLKRGYCCGNNCRHCPYPAPPAP